MGTAEIFTFAPPWPFWRPSNSETIQRPHPSSPPKHNPGVTKRESVKIIMKGSPVTWQIPRILDAL
jgi:hypothetical protein